MKKRARGLNRFYIERVRLDRSATKTRNFVKCSVEREFGYSSFAIPLANKETGHAPIGESIQTCLVVLSIFDIREFNRSPELAPAEGVFSVEHKCGLGAPLTDQPLLGVAIRFCTDPWAR